MPSIPAASSTPAGDDWAEESAEQKRIVERSLLRLRESPDLAWQLLLGAIDALAVIVSVAGKNGRPDQRDIAREALVSAVANACGAIRSVAGWPPSADVERLKQALAESQHNDVLVHVLIDLLRAWRTAAREGPGLTGGERPRVLPGATTTEPASSEGGPVTDYDAAYARTKALCERIQAEREKVQEAAAAELGPLEEELERAAIRFEPHFNARVRTRLESHPPKTVAERSEFCEWLMAETRGLGFQLFEPVKKRLAYLTIFPGRDDWRLVPIGATNGRSRMKLADFMPFQLSAFGRRN